MPYPPLVVYATEAEYEAHFGTTYCAAANAIKTFDGIPVKFLASDFKHAFYDSTDWVARDKNLFSNVRAQRIEWIRAALEDQNAALFEGYQKNTGYARNRRVCVVERDYMVVIRFPKAGEARFVTAYVADTPRSLRRILSSPRW